MLMNSTGCGIDGVSIDLLMQRLSTASGLEELACRGCDVILEAVSEDLQIKRQVIGSMFDALKANAVLPEQVIICSNTISISIERSLGTCHRDDLQWRADLNRNTTCLCML